MWIQRAFYVVVGPPGVSLDGADSTLTRGRPCDVTYDSYCWSSSSLITARKTCLSILGSPSSRKPRGCFPTMHSYQFKPQWALPQCAFFFSLFHFWTTIILRKIWLKKEIVLLLSFTCNWVQCFISYNPNIITSLAMHHRAGETFTLSWLLMRSTAVPRWTKVIDEPGWTTWQWNRYGLGGKTPGKHTGTICCHRCATQKKYWVVLVNFIHSYFSMVLLLICCLLTSFLKIPRILFLFRQ